MVVVVDSGPLAATSLLREVPEEKWLDLMRIRRDYMHIRLSYDCRCLVQFVKDAEVMYRVVGFKSVKEMIRKGYDLSPEEVNVALKWLRLNPSDDPVTLRRALAGPDGEPKATGHGGKRSKLTEKNVRLYGNNAAYRIAVLKRDKPEYAARYAAGEFPTVAAAERAAEGISGTLVKLRKAWERATPEDRATFLSELMQ